MRMAFHFVICCRTYTTEKNSILQIDVFEFGAICNVPIDCNIFKTHENFLLQLSLNYALQRALSYKLKSYKVVLLFSQGRAWLQQQKIASRQGERSQVRSFSLEIILFLNV